MSIDWAAGLYEGEGCAWRTHPSIFVGVANTDRSLLERFQAGVQNHGKIYGPYDYGHKPIYKWQVASKAHVETVLQKLWPYLSNIRRIQAVNTLGKNIFIDTIPPASMSIEWASGFFDGEGSVSIFNKSIGLSLGNTNLEALQWFYKAIGTLGSICGPYTEPKYPNRKPMYRWYCTKLSNVLSIVTGLWGYLSVRRRQQIIEAFKRNPKSNLSFLSRIGELTT